MGVDRNAAALLLKARMDGVAFGRTLTLGRLNVYLEPAEYARLLARVGHAPADVPLYADDLLRALGATSVESMDVSGYEGVSLIHDMNQPVPDEWQCCYDVVLDAGTLEHVFDVRTAFANCMRMVRPGGRFLSITPANSWFGHGFFQFSPELFFRAFGPANGFSIVEMYVANADGKTYAVQDPAAVNARVELSMHEPVYLMVHARREQAVDVLREAPQQSDYVAIWSEAAATPGVTPTAPPRPARWKTLPVIKQVLLKRRRFRYYRHRSLANRKFFRPVDLGF